LYKILGLFLEAKRRFAIFLRAAISGPGALGARRRRAPDVSDARSTHFAQLEDLVMRTYDIRWRSTIGFDRFFDLIDAAWHTAGDDNYPSA
jgi:hypothetical protein